MTWEEACEALDAQPIGSGRALAHCPAHQDKHRSLAITKGEGGRILIKDWAGCSLQAILTASGLSIKHLFADSKPLSAGEASQLESRRAAQEARRQALVDYTREIFDREREAELEVRRVGQELARLPLGALSEIRLTMAFHAAMDALRMAEAESERVLALARKHWRIQPVQEGPAMGGRERVAA
jgi:hypothetical protein